MLKKLWREAGRIRAGRGPSSRPIIFRYRERSNGRRKDNLSRWRGSHCHNRKGGLITPQDRIDARAAMVSRECWTLEFLQIPAKGARRAVDAVARFDSSMAIGADAEDAIAGDCRARQANRPEEQGENCDEPFHITPYSGDRGPPTTGQKPFQDGCAVNHAS